MPLFQTEEWCGSERRSIMINTDYISHVINKDALCIVFMNCGADFLIPHESIKPFIVNALDPQQVINERK